MTNTLFVCNCGSLEHQFVVTQLDDEEEIYIDVRLSTYGNVFKRLLRAIKYVFNVGVGDYNEVILDKEQQQKLMECLKDDV
jgi:hypothetical protein|tara:strand:+ start:586 stop:828 length:243 start_codon:yes stop_codon:yes gene_type:complete